MPEGTAVSPEQEGMRHMVVGSKAALQKCHWGLSSAFAPSLAAEEPLALGKGAQSQVTQRSEQETNESGVEDDWV